MGAACKFLKDFLICWVHLAIHIIYNMRLCRFYLNNFFNALCLLNCKWAFVTNSEFVWDHNFYIIWHFFKFVVLSFVILSFECVAKLFCSYSATVSSLNLIGGFEECRVFINVFKIESPQTEFSRQNLN